MCPCFEINQFCVSHAQTILFRISSFIHRITDGINALTSFFFCFPLSVFALISLLSLSFFFAHSHIHSLPFPLPFFFLVLTHSLSVFLSLPLANICVTYLELNTNALFFYTFSMSNIKMSSNLTIWRKMRPYVHNPCPPSLTVLWDQFSF